MRLLPFSLVRKASHLPARGIRWLHTVKQTPQALQAQGPARTRFAPSPTGDLHLGSLRTALFNFLIAKATGGQFLLRIEDTDQKRTVEGAEQRLYDDLRWAGIEWDEGPIVGGPYGPYRQSERTELYRKYATELLESGNAYRCFCSQERLRTLAEHKSKLGLPADYDRTCVHVSKEESDERASKGESHVVRLQVPDKYPIYEDLVYGIVKQRKSPVSRTVQAQSFEDPILLKTDGFPTYHLANVVDDHLMNITHVVRGTEWMSSTPKHLSMYKAFGWTPPKFAHVGLLVDMNKQKLSKRTGSIDIASYRNNGVFPEALTNFVALLGWSHYEKSDVMSLNDLIQNFTLKFTKGDATVAFEKLSYLQRRHATRYAGVKPYHSNPTGALILQDLALRPIISLLENSEATLSSYQDIPRDKRNDYVQAILTADIANYTFPEKFIERNRYFFAAPAISELRSSMAGIDTGGQQPNSTVAIPQKDVFPLIKDSLHKLSPEWRKDDIKAAIEQVVEESTNPSVAEPEGSSTPVDTTVSSEDATMDLAIRKALKKLVLTYMRWALVCRMDGPDTTETIRLLGREEVLKRFETAEKVLREEKV